MILYESLPTSTRPGFKLEVAEQGSATLTITSTAGTSTRTISNDGLMKLLVACLWTDEGQDLIARIA